MAKPLQGPPRGVYWHVLQTHRTAEIAFNRYWDMNRKSRVNQYGDVVRDRGILREKPNESEKRCVLINRSAVFFQSGENYEDLRAETLHGAVIDEFRQQDRRLWSTVIRPMLGRYKGWCDILSTANGFDHFKDLWDVAQADPEWDTFHASCAEAPWWTAEELASARSTMAEDEYAQEILAEFREMGAGNVYKSHHEGNRVLENPFSITGQDWSPHLPIIVGLDFNVGLMCWALGQHKADEWYWGDEIAVPNTNTEYCATVLAEKVRGHPSGVILCGDASGKSRRSSATENDYQIILKALKDAGVTVRNETPESNPPIRQRVNTVNSALQSMTGAVRMRYHKLRCKVLGTDLQRVKWRQGTGEIDLDKRDAKLTHMSDAVGYPLCRYAKEFKAKPGVVHVIVR